MQNEKISIIVPVYNVEKYLPRCVDSLLNQTYSNLEIILVEDGATDSSATICEEYQKKDNRIKVIHKTNGGLSDARNKGIKIATGEYIACVDSDDYVTEDMYEILLKNLKETNAAISVGNYKMVADGEEKKEERTHTYHVIENKPDMIANLLENSYIQNYAWNKLYKRELFKEITYPYGKKMEDLGTTYLLFDKCSKIVYTKDIVYYYYQREDSIVNKKNLSLILDKLELTLQRYTYLKDRYPGVVQIDKDMIMTCVSAYQYLYENSEKQVLQDKNVITIYQLYRKTLKAVGMTRLIEHVNMKTKIKVVLLYLNKNIFKYYVRIISKIK